MKRAKLKVVWGGGGGGGRLVLFWGFGVLFVLGFCFVVGFGFFYIW